MLASAAIVTTIVAYFVNWRVGAPALSVRAIENILTFRSRKMPTVASDFLHAHTSAICAPVRYASTNCAPRYLSCCDFATLKQSTRFASCFNKFRKIRPQYR